MNAETFISALRAVEEQGDVSAMVRLYADDAELRNPTDQQPHTGPQGAEQFWTAYRHAFERIQSDFHAVVERDGQAMLEWTSRGRTATGNDFEYDGVTVLEYNGDRVQRFRAYFDPADLAVPMTPEGGRAPRAD